MFIHWFHFAEKSGVRAHPDKVHGTLQQQAQEASAWCGAIDVAAAHHAAGPPHTK